MSVVDAVETWAQRERVWVVMVIMPLAMRYTEQCRQQKRMWVIIVLVWMLPLSTVRGKGSGGRHQRVAGAQHAAARYAVAGGCVAVG